MNKINILLFFTLFLSSTFPQSDSIKKSAILNYDLFKEVTIKEKRFKHNLIKNLIEKIKQKNIFEINIAGKSYENREIFLLKYGNGAQKVFLWSQMHGDEPTATMAIFDLINFLMKNIDHQKSLGLFNNLSIYFMPMVNPDGAERFKRRNAQNIDINRDFIRKQTPEAKILLSAFNKIKPDFAFNLHDQNIFYTAGKFNNPASISFLAPAPDSKLSNTENRLRAMKLISHLISELNNYIPEKIGRYSDDYEPRAFGDNFQKLGASTILIETGGIKDDTEKQFLRKINFITLLTALFSISENSYENFSTDLYNSLPENEINLFSVLIKNVNFINNHNDFKTDMGVNLYEQMDDQGNIFFKSELTDIGDLSTFFGYQEIDFENNFILEGLVSSDTIKNIEQLDSINFSYLYEKGILFLFVKQEILSVLNKKYPINLISTEAKNIKNLTRLPEPGKSVNFISKKDNKVNYAVLNGFLYDCNNKTGYVKNGLIFK